MMSRGTHCFAALTFTRCSLTSAMNISSNTHADRIVTFTWIYFLHLSAALKDIAVSVVMLWILLLHDVCKMTTDVSHVDNRFWALLTCCVPCKKNRTCHGSSLKLNGYHRKKKQYTDKRSQVDKWIVDHLNISMVAEGYYITVGSECTLKKCFPCCTPRPVRGEYDEGQRFA